MSICNRKRRPYADEKGHAFILVLILLALGSLLIAPALRYTATGMYSLRVSENKLSNLYTADSAVDDALWQLLNQLMGKDMFSPSNPQIAYDFQIGAERLPITIKIPSVPASENYGKGNVHNLMVEVSPKWVDPPPGGETNIFEYTMRIDMETYNLVSFRYTLPEGLSFVSSSSYFKGPDSYNTLAWDAEVNLTTHQVKNKSAQWVSMSLSNYTVVYAWPPTPNDPTTSYLYITTGADGRQTLEFRPYYGNPSGRRVLIQTCKVTGSPPWGVNYIKPAGFYYARSTITVDQTAAIGVAMYAILIPIGGVTYQVVVGYDYATGGFKIVSYEIIG